MKRILRIVLPIIAVVGFFLVSGGSAYATRYTATFDVNEGTGTPASLYCDTVGLEQSCQITIPTRGYKPLRPGYKFDGWYPELGFPANRIKPEQFGQPYTLDKDVRFKAFWVRQPFQITVTFAASGGRFSSGEDKIEGHCQTLLGHNSCKITVPSQKPSRSGFEFKGYANYPDSSVVKYTSGESWDFWGDQTVYAIWVEEREGEQQPTEPAQPVQPTETPNSEEDDQSEDSDDSDENIYVPRTTEPMDPAKNPLVESEEACRFFIGMVSWDCGTGLTDGTEINSDTIGTSIWVIAANIIYDISVIATYLVIGYVIYGGYLYMFSGGDTSKVATGKKTLTQAFIGLAIAMSATAILGAIRIALGANFAAELTDEPVFKMETAGGLVVNLVNWVIGISGVVATTFLIYGATSYITSAGEPQKVEKAKKTVFYAIVGLIIIALAATITAFVSNAIRTANDTAQNNLQNQIIISKEVKNGKNI